MTRLQATSWVVSAWFEQEANQTGPASMHRVSQRLVLQVCKRRSGAGDMGGRVGGMQLTGRDAGSAQCHCNALPEHGSPPLPSPQLQQLT